MASKNLLTGIKNIMEANLKDLNICVIGLGYVGLPLLTELKKKFPSTIGFDINKKRVLELKDKVDSTNEVSKEALELISDSVFYEPSGFKNCCFFVVTVPTPVNHHNVPDLKPLHDASELIGSFLKLGDIVVYESTVYPGATEEYCLPILEKNSGLKCNIDFSIGYSPERINPGDTKYRLPNIKKVVSASNNLALRTIFAVYHKIITAGVYKAASIKVAEAAKVIENTQRDLNISLINELTKIFDLMDIDTNDVLEAASTKWNFLNFKPGLVGGHCIGVDPYYLTYKAQSLGYYPEVILAGRRINDSYPKYVASKLIKSLLKKKFSIDNSRCLILGYTFKENCPDTRNTKVLDLYNELSNYNLKVDIYDPLLIKSINDHKKKGLRFIKSPKKRTYQSIILAVPHDEFIAQGVSFIKGLLVNKDCIFFDLKAIFDKKDSNLRL